MLRRVGKWILFVKQKCGAILADSFLSVRCSPYEAYTFLKSTSQVGSRNLPRPSLTANMRSPDCPSSRTLNGTGFHARRPSFLRRSGDHENVDPDCAAFVAGPTSIPPSSITPGITSRPKRSHPYLALRNQFPCQWLMLRQLSKLGRHLSKLGRHRTIRHRSRTEQCRLPPRQLYTNHLRGWKRQVLEEARGLCGDWERVLPAYKSPRGCFLA